MVFESNFDYNVTKNGKIFESGSGHLPLIFVRAKMLAGMGEIDRLTIGLDREYKKLQSYDVEEIKKIDIQTLQYLSA